MRRRGRRTIDVGRLRDALSGPGADPRSWSFLARVDDDPDAIRWEPGTGWLVDVTATSGELAGEDFIVCRVLSRFGGPGNLSSCPVRRGAEVYVELPSGDPNVSPVITGYLHNPEDQAVPTTVNAEQITEALALANELIVTASGLLAQYGGDVRLGAPAIYLAEAQATQSFVRGQDQAQALHDVLDAIASFCDAVQLVMTSVPFAKPGLELPSVQLEIAIASAKAAITAALSARIRGE